MNIEIANRLQKLRKENGYSQEELADKLGISRQAVSKWERAESSPDTDNLIILARLYNMSLDELLYDNETDDEIRERTIDKEENNKKDSLSITDDEGQTLKIENGHLKALNANGEEVKFDKKKAAILSVIDGSIALLTLTAYLLWSFLANAWYVSWVLWILMPAIMSIAEAIMKKQFTKFVYPLLVTAVYLYLGMEFKLWHPLWVLFITIPIYYVIFEPIDKYVLKSKELDEDEELDEDDDED